MSDKIDPYAVIGLLFFGGIAWFIYKTLSSMEAAWDGWRQKQYDAARLARQERVERLKLKRERLRRKQKIEVIEEDDT